MVLIVPICTFYAKLEGFNRFKNLLKMHNLNYILLDIDLMYAMKQVQNEMTFIFCCCDFSNVDKRITNINIVHLV